MQSNNLFEYIIQNLDDARYSKASKWVACKCPYCDTSSNKRHMNIQLKEHQPLIYKCFRASCGVQGVLTKKVARDLGLTNSVFLKIIDKKYNENIMIDATKKTILKGIHDVDLGDISEECAAYFKKRTGRVLNSTLQHKFRICSSINQFIDKNSHIAKLNMDNLNILAYRENMQNKKFIYFFNDRYTMVYGREIGGDLKIKTSIISDKTGLASHIPYTFRSDGEYQYKDTDAEGTLFLGEGVFDIINAYFHLYHNYKGVFMASTSFTATPNCINLFSKYIFEPNIIILSDDDVKITTYEKFLKYNKINKNRIHDLYVVYNKDAKDLGDYTGNKFNINTYKLYSKNGG